VPSRARPGRFRLPLHALAAGNQNSSAFENPSQGCALQNAGGAARVHGTGAFPPLQGGPGCPQPCQLCPSAPCGWGGRGGVAPRGTHPTANAALQASGTPSGPVIALTKIQPQLISLRSKRSWGRKTRWTLVFGHILDCSPTARVRICLPPSGPHSPTKAPRAPTPRHPRAACGARVQGLWVACGRLSQGPSDPPPPFQPSCPPPFVFVPCLGAAHSQPWTPAAASTPPTPPSCPAPSPPSGTTTHPLARTWWPCTTSCRRCAG
jgi:hypothetical protein